MDHEARHHLTTSPLCANSFEHANKVWLYNVRLQNFAKPLASCAALDVQ